MNILNKIKAIINILTHRHSYIITMDGRMTDEEIVEQAFNTVCVHYLGQNCKGWKGKSPESLQARCDMIRSALHDRNLIMLSEHDGKYYVMRDCDIPERVDELMSLCLPDEEDGEVDYDLLAAAKLVVGRACPYDTFGATKVGSNACWQCPAYRATLDRGKRVLCDNAITADMTLNGK